MLKHKSRKKMKFPRWAKWAITAIIVPIVIALIPPLLSTDVPIDKKTPLPPSPTPSCISAADILVTFHISKNGEVIAEPAASETVFLDPDLRVYFKVEINSVTNSILPELECKWTNTGIATDGKLLHNTGCSMIDYKSGHIYIKDAIAMQLSQPSCPALAPYPLFIMPKQP